MATLHLPAISLRVAGIDGFPSYSFRVGPQTIKAGLGKLCSARWTVRNSPHYTLLPHLTNLHCFFFFYSRNLFANLSTGMLTITQYSTSPSLSKLQVRILHILPTQSILILNPPNSKSKLLCVFLPLLIFYCSVLQPSCLPSPLHNTVAH